MTPCRDKNSNICVAEGCYAEACDRKGVDLMTADDRLARAFENVERNTHEMVKIFTDIYNSLENLGEILKEGLYKEEVTDDVSRGSTSKGT